MNDKFTVTYHRETELAYLVSEDGDIRNGIWLPKSLTEIVKNLDRQLAEEPESGDTLVVEIPEWLAGEKELI